MLALFIIIPLVLAIVIYMLSFKDGKQVCDNYVLISYLYALFYICLTAYTTMMIFLNLRHMIDVRNFNFYVYISIVLALSIIYTGLFMITIILPKKYIILKHVLSLAVVVLGSILLSIVFLTFAPDAIFVALIMTVLLFVLLTIIAWKFQDSISSKINIVFIIAFVAMILIELIVVLLFPNSIFASIIIFIVLLMLCYLLLVKTKRMIENSKTCKDDGVPDYVKEGLGLLLSFKNIFLQILQLRARR